MNLNKGLSAGRDLTSPRPARATLIEGSTVAESLGAEERGWDGVSVEMKPDGDVIRALCAGKDSEGFR